MGVLTFTQSSYKNARLQVSDLVCTFVHYIGLLEMHQANGGILSIGYISQESARKKN